MRARAVAAVVPQLEMQVEDPEQARKEREREVDDQHRILTEFFAACREVVRESSYDYVANQLEAIWGDDGRHVSAGVLKNSLSPTSSERNYFRFEWAIWFARGSERCADLLAEIIGMGKPKKDFEEEYEHIVEVLREEYPKQAGVLIRKGKNKPTRRR